MGRATCCLGCSGHPPTRPTQPAYRFAELTGVAARRVGGVCRGHLCGAGLIAQGDGPADCDSQSRGRGLCNPADRHTFRAGYEAGSLRAASNSRKAVVVGLSFWIGVGFQNQVIFADFAGQDVGPPYSANGMTAGRYCRDSADCVYGVDGSAPPTSRGRVGRCLAAQDRRVPPRLCRENRLGRSGDRAAARCRGRDFGDF